MNSFISTRSAKTAAPVTFCQALVNGIAEDGGLYVAESIPQLDLDTICSLARLPYHARAALVYRAFDTGVPDADVDRLMQKAYADNFDTPEIAPVRQLEPGTYVLELFHGPTCAFKDMALQCLPQFFDYASAELRAQGTLDTDHLILVATSGDTGKAALEGFAHSGHAKVMVFYPDKGVSDVQLRQMTTQTGANVCVMASRSDFDGCQTSVKQAFADTAFTRELKEKHGLALSSANSINWGRLMPQIVYYLSAYAQMVDTGALASGDPLDICVPTGNFGNILAAYYAHRMGMPLGVLMCASNKNDVLTEFINTGVYDAQSRRLHSTPSPSMDILISSNLERQLFELAGRDSAAVGKWMAELSQTRRFAIQGPVLERMQQLYRAECVENTRCLQVIGETFETAGFLPDPHTAVALECARRLRTQRPVLVASTAHWAKFGADVWRGLHGLDAASELPQDVAGLNGLELLDVIARETGSPVPEPISALRGAARRFYGVVDGTCEGVESSVRAWLDPQENN